MIGIFYFLTTVYASSSQHFYRFERAHSTFFAMQQVYSIRDLNEQRKMSFYFILNLFYRIRRTLHV